MPIDQPDLLSIVFRVGVALAVWWGIAGSLIAEDYQEGFEGPDTSWMVDRGAAPVAVHRHERSADAALIRTGRQAESVSVQTQPDSSVVCRLVHPLPPTVRMDETQVAVWVWSDHPGVSVSVRVRFPRQLNPRTSKPLVVSITGDQHRGGGQYQRLAVKLDDREFASSMRRVRDVAQRQLGIRNVNDQGAYLDQITIHLTEEARTWNLALDDLELRPVVTPPDLETGQDTESYAGSRIRIGDDRILLDHQPLFPLFMPYHGEQPPVLASSLCNVIWVPDYLDQELLQKCAEAGLGVMATPPQPDFARESPDDTGLAPFGANTDPVLLWMLDARIPADQVEHAATWAEMVRDADRHRERPILADVMANEREFHRSVDFLGVSRSILHSSVTPQTYLETLEQRRRLSLPGKPMFTLIPTEPSPEWLNTRFAGATVPVVEPEQIWMLANAALAAGYKGLGYLTYQSLEGNAVGVEERRRAIEIQNFRIRLIEPWLATGKVLLTLPVQVGPSSVTREGKKLSPLASRWDVRPLADDQSPEAQAASKIRATALECDQGLIILVNWLDQESQYQPGAMNANDVYLLLNRNIVHAWELTTTSLREHTLEVTPVAGGTQIRLKQFDQSAVILISKDQLAEEVIRKRVEQYRPVASKAWAGLARAKLSRVRAVHEELVSLVPREFKVAHAERFLRQASYYVDQCEKALLADRLTEVEQHAVSAMLNLRHLQSAYWSQAVAPLTSPVASPHAICFQTLPDHWRMANALQGEIQTAKSESTTPVVVNESQNLLPSGEFESLKGLLDAGWHRESFQEGPLVSRAELLEPGRSGRSCLHLSVATKGASKLLATTFDEPSVRMTSPPLAVVAGQLVKIRGQVRIMKSMQQTRDGLVITDSLLGPSGSLRFQNSTSGGGWQPFELIREVPQDGEFQVTIELFGLGAASLDSLQISTIDLATP